MKLKLKKVDGVVRLGFVETEDSEFIFVDNMEVTDIEVEPIYYKEFGGFVDIASYKLKLKLYCENSEFYICL